LLMEECAGSPEVLSNQYSRRIKSAASRLDRLVIDALSYSKAVTEDLVLEPVALAELVPGLIESYPDFMPDKADIEIAPNLPTVLGTPSALTQCFSNLISNAVKFTKPGVKPRIRILAGEITTASTAGGSDQPSFNPPRSYQNNLLYSNMAGRPKSYVRIWVEDEGIGVAKDSRQRIFGLFQQAAKIREGTGLGLAIVRKVVNHMGGEVGVESEEGKGSRFWVDLQVP
jgi:signal transduction histidine kinase